MTMGAGLRPDVSTPGTVGAAGGQLPAATRHQEPPCRVLDLRICQFLEHLSRHLLRGILGEPEHHRLALPPFLVLITYEAQLPTAGPRWQGFRRLRDDLSGWIDRRFALSNNLRHRSAIVSGPGLRIVRNQVPG